jgi:hypothetical protein
MEGDHLDNLGKGGRIMLYWILMAWVGRMWIGLVWHRIGTSGKLL